MRLAPLHPWLVAAAGMTGAVMLGVAVPAATPAPASAASAAVTSVAVQGHGWGHGRGMGQWGALGYALAGQPASWILGHYYGGTSSGTVPNDPIRVRMVENDGNDVIVTSGSAFNAAGTQVPAGRAVLLHYTGSGSTWNVSSGPGCAGPWSPAGQTTSPLANPPSADPNAPASSLLQICMANGNVTVRGALTGAQVGGVERTVDVLPLESYLRGVVASESPAYWGTIGPTGPDGHPQGFQALEAQAVAARSYAVADQDSGSGGAYGYADICDSTSCQVYRGVAGENSISDRAIAATAGQVRTFPSGVVASTEFSSSTGGWTSGGTFPAVADDGDAVCVSSACNPNHDWTTTLSASDISGAFPSIGTLTSVAVVGRSGPSSADWGGRATQVSINGTGGAVTVTGATFAADFGLRSDFFTIGGDPPPPATPPTTTAPTTTSTTAAAPTTTTSSTTTTLAPPPPPPPPPVIPAAFASRAQRVAGADRLSTAVASSRLAYPSSGSAGGVVITRADDYADALAGGPLAGANHGPLLLTAPSGLDPTVLSEVQRVLPAGRTVFVLGGTKALSPSVDSALTGAGYKVVRIEGPTRYATAVAVAHQMGDPAVVFEVSGLAFPDGLAAGPAAVARAGVILLTSGSAPSQETASYLAGHPADQRYAVGAPAAHADPSAVSLSGPDRFATSAAVAARFFPGAAVAGVATGLDFPDALAAGPALKGAGPLLLVPHTGPAPGSVASYLASLGANLRTLDVFGGPEAVSS